MELEDTDATVALNNDDDSKNIGSSNDGIVFSKFRIYKNLAVISVAVMLLLCALLPCRELQGSINIQDGLGTYSLTVYSLTTVVAMVFLPPLLIQKIGLKHSVTFSLVGVTVYYLANFKPSWATMIPAAVISGIGVIPIWPAKATYITLLAERWSDVFHTPLDSTVSFLFGIFYAFYYFGYVWGNVATYFILTPSNETSVLGPNETSVCGLYFCDSDALEGNVSFKRPPDQEIYILFGVFIAMSLLGAIMVSFFLDHIDLPQTEEVSIVSLLLKTLRNLAQPKQVLLLPLGILRGILRTFLATEFTKAFVTCSWGVRNIGLTMLGFGIVCGTMSLLLGRLVRWTGRLPLFILSMAIHVVVAVIIIEWKPSTNELFLYFLVPCLLGVSNSIWESQVATIYAIVFPGEKEVVFTIYGLSEDIGGMLAYSYSAALCMHYKLLIFSVSVVVAFVCYLITEFRFLRTSGKRDYN